MKIREHGYLTLSFLFPFIILGTLFALRGVFPFGSRQILINDFFHQYYPFLSSFWHKLREGAVSTWSWTAGMGHDYVAIIAYYMASPLNLLAFLAPHAWLREALTFILLVKIGCAGLFTAMFLRYTFRQNGPGLAVFSSLYALCAFVLGYYPNIMWFDSFALLPLVMMGLLSLMREGKYRLYIFSLAMAVFSNFYISFFICAFTAVAFLGLCFIRKITVREFLLKLGLIAAFSAIALGMTAVLTLPAFSAVQSTYSFKPILPPGMFLYDGFFDVLGYFIAFTPATSMIGLPNLYSGMICVLLAGVFVTSPKVSPRGKIVLCGIFVFLIFSCNIIVLDYMVHGFRYTNGMPSRFSFIISFILVIMAYRAFLLIEDTTNPPGCKAKANLLAMGISAALFLLAAVFGSQEKNSITGSAVLCVFYLLICYALMSVKTEKVRVVVRLIFFLVIISELFITSRLTINSVETTGRNEYPDRYEQTQALLRQRRSAANDFYRTEILPIFTLNDSSLYDYNGITFFSSTIDTNVVMFLNGLGLLYREEADNTIYYYLTTPLSNAFLAMRYIITVERGVTPDDGIYWEAAGKAGDAFLLENKNYLPLGFMADKGLVAYAHNAGDPFMSQNNLFKRATGLDDSLFMVTKYTSTANELSWNYKMPSDGMLYTYFISDRDDTISILLNNSFFSEMQAPKTHPFISIVGKFKQGDIITFKSGINTQINVGCINMELFEKGYALLADEPLELTHFSNTKVSGTVTALKDGILYTSIPGKNWNVYVDGVKSELLLIDNAMAAVRLGKGVHNVEFRYFNKSFAAGIIISFVSLAVFVILVLTEKRRRGDC